MYKCLVVRETEYETNEAYRTFEEFCELYQLLLKTFSNLKFDLTPSFSKFKETKSLKRFRAIELFLKEICGLQAEISHSDIIYTFFHPILRDRNQETFYVNNDKGYSDINTKNLLNDNRKFEKYYKHCNI